MLFPVNEAKRPYIAYCDVEFCNILNVLGERVFTPRAVFKDAAADPKNDPPAVPVWVELPLAVITSNSECCCCDAVALYP